MWGGYLIPIFALIFSVSASVRAEADDIARAKLRTELEQLGNDWVIYLQTLKEQGRLTEEVMRTIREEIQTMDESQKIPDRKWSKPGNHFEPIRKRLFCMRDYVRCETNQCLAPYAANLDSQSCDNTCSERMTVCLDTLVPRDTASNPKPKKKSKRVRPTK